MPSFFYSTKEYRKKQSEITKRNWRNGKYSFRVKELEIRICRGDKCEKTFLVKPYDPKIFCSHVCSARASNLGRKHSFATKLKISKSVSALPKLVFQRQIVPRHKLVCLACKSAFLVPPYLAKMRKYCSASCAIKTIGSRTTSPKASKGKSGIRKDIDPNICFYSTWEANVARVYNLVNLKWMYAPKVFDLGGQNYRPDFFLTKYDMFIEVKNFLGPYSLNRHNLFKEKFPEVDLELILKEDYIKIRDNYKCFINNWED